MESDYTIVAIFLLICGIAIYFIPTFQANKVNHPSKTGIIILNIFLGWTLIGWVGALIWAFSSPSGGGGHNTIYHCIHCQNKTKIKSDFCPVCGKNTDGYTLEYLRMIAELKLKERQDAAKAQSPESPN